MEAAISVCIRVGYLYHIPCGMALPVFCMNTKYIVHRAFYTYNITYFVEEVDVDIMSLLLPDILVFVGFCVLDPRNFVKSLINVYQHFKK